MREGSIGVLALARAKRIMGGAKPAWLVKGTFVAVAVMIAHIGAAAQPVWPSKPITMIVPYPAGGVVDVLARAVAEKVSTDFGQPIIVENKPGANANIAAATVAAADPDGYTLLVSAPFLINNPLLEQGLRWKPSDFVPVARFALSPNYFVVPVDSPYKSVEDYVKAAKASSAPLQYGDAGPGTPQSMAIEMLKSVAHVRLDSILYKGAPPIVPDLVTKRLTMAVLPALVAAPQIKAGKLRALANTSDKRSPALPEVPTIAEAGYPDMTVLAWYGIHARKGTPAAVVAKLSDAIGKALKEPGIRAQMAGASGEAAYMDKDEFAKFTNVETARWTGFMQALDKK